MPRNGLPALSFEQVHRIRTARLPDAYFAKVYGVCKDSIGNARRGRTYKDHPTPIDPVGRSGLGRHATGNGTIPLELDIEPKDRTLYERLRAWVEVDEAGCWMWTGAYHSSTRYPSGHHGQVSIAKGETTGTHRAMWIAVHGSIPDGMQVLHRCDKPKCIHPEHLFLGTHADNMADMNRKGRNGMKGRRRADFVGRITSTPEPT